MSDLVNSDLFISLVVFFPALAALVVFIMPNDDKPLLRRLSLILSIIPLLLVLLMWFNYDRFDAGIQFEVQAEWFSAIGASYHMGIDGITLPMFLLTTILTPLAILASFNIEDNVKMYMVLFLIMETAMLGLFASLDLIVFFIFWEFGLVPMYFLIKLWGGKDRDYASFKFFIYTMAGSLGLLLSIQVMGIAMGTFDIIELQDQWVALGMSGTLAGSGLSVALVKNISYWAFFIAFAIKVPIWPFHTWLPDAHTQAPTAGSMILAGVLLKLGAYGFIRLVIPLFPEQAHQTAYILAILGAISIILGGFAAYGQWDFKRLVAYSSINHMGFVVIGIAAMAFVYGANDVTQEAFGDDALLATSGAVFQMVNHGLSAAGMFFMVGVIYDRAHTRDLKKLGGIWAITPVFGTIMIFVSMASLGLPGLNGFVSEFMIARGVWGIFPWALAVSMVGLLMTGAYILKGIGETLHGPIKEEWAGLTDMTLREHAVIWPLMVLMFSLGIWPQWIVVFINDTLSKWF